MPNSGITIYDVPANPDDPNCSTFTGRPAPYGEDAETSADATEPVLRAQLEAMRDAKTLAEVRERATAAIELLNKAEKWSPPTYASQTYRVVPDPEPFDD